MKKLIIGKCMKYIKNKTNYDDVKLKEIEYGLVSIYLTFSKIIIILIISIILGILKEVIIFMFCFNAIRTFAFGLHATKSWICLLSSTLIFIVIPFTCTFLNINVYIKLALGLICTLLMLKNAPADTKKRPIVSKVRRNIYKSLSVILSIAFSIYSVYTKNNFISNCLIFALIVQNILIAPYVYRLFKLPYNNYINFLKEHPDFAN